MSHDSIKFLKHFLALRKEQWNPVEELQNKGLAQLREAARKTKYYGSKIPPPGSSFDLASFAPTDKNDVISNPEQFLAVPMATLKPAKTSGSTGNYAIVYLDQETLIKRTAFRIFLESEFGRSPHDLAIQIHGSCPKASLPSRFGLYRKKFLSIFDSDDGNFEALRKSGATVFGSYASALTVMAAHNNRLETPLRMKLMFSYGEVLNSEARKFIEESFSCRVFQLYGSTEFGPIAFECPEERKLHVNAGSFMVELVDSKNRPSKSGEVLVTSLVNLAMPLIRYRIGDLATWGKCSCGRTWPVLDSIQGRIDDYAVLPSGKTRSAFSFFGPYKAPNLKAYQIVQEKRDKFLFRYVSWPPGLSKASKEEIKRRIKVACLGEDAGVELQEVESLPKGRTGKLRHFISKVAKE